MTRDHRSGRAPVQRLPVGPHDAGNPGRSPRPPTLFLLLLFSATLLGGCFEHNGDAPARALPTGTEDPGVILTGRLAMPDTINQSLLGSIQPASGSSEAVKAALASEARAVVNGKDHLVSVSTSTLEFLIEGVAPASEYRVRLLLGRLFLRTMVRGSRHLGVLDLRTTAASLLEDKLGFPAIDLLASRPVMVDTLAHDLERYFRQTDPASMPAGLDLGRYAPLLGTVASASRLNGSPLAGVRFWAGLVPSGNLEPSVASMAASHFDLLVVDRLGSRQGQAGFDAASAVRRLQASPASHGGNKVILAAIDLVVARNTRTWWQPGWQVASPDWILPAGPGEASGSFPVRFWRAEWRTVLQFELDAVLADGYDGIVLGSTDSRFQPAVASAARLDGKNTADELISLIGWMAEYARSRRPGFLVLAGNASEMASDAGFSRTVDALVQEHVWYDGTSDPGRLPGDLIVPATSTAALLANLHTWQMHGKPVFDLEFAHLGDFVARAYQLGRDNGFVTSVSLRPLDQLPTAPPPGY